MYDSKGRLTREGALAIIARGEGVNIGGRVYTNAAHLPDEATFAAGDSEREATVLASLDAQIAALAAQRARLTPLTAQVSEAPAEGETPDDAAAKPKKGKAADDADTK